MKLLLILCLFPTAAMATLGETEKSVEQYRKSLRAPKVRVAADGYTVHEITSAGISVKEYVSPSGVVFAVSWRGITKPDLSQLLGTYFTQYAANPGRRGEPPPTIKTSEITVQERGHMRDLRGLAFVSALVPDGVDVGSFLP